MINVVDVGTTWGIPTARMFDGEHGTTIVHKPTNYDEYDELLRNGCADVVSFGGGADIHPSIYNHRNVASGVGVAPSRRDFNEVLAFNLARDLGVPILGICRGAQLACAMAGGYLIQDVSNHAGRNHPIVDLRDRAVYQISSAHHQMMYPFAMSKEDYSVIAQVPENMSTKYTFDTRSATRGRDVAWEKPANEPEIVYFTKAKALAVQGHPEFMDPEHPTVKYVKRLMNEFILTRGEKFTNV